MHDWWIRSWDGSYRELRVDDLRSVQELKRSLIMRRDRLREEKTLVEIDRHGSKVEEFDVEGILNVAELVLPRASDLWIQASLE